MSMMPWLELNAKQRKAMKWVNGLGHDMAVSPGAVGWLIEHGYLKPSAENERRLILTEKGQTAWDACPEHEKT
jgi:hypothetical protein